MWRHMDYFNDVLTTSLGHEHGSCIAVCRVRKLSDFIKNILNRVPKMNKGLTGLERHDEGEQLMTELSFLGELSL